MTPEAILIAILGIFPHMSGHNRQCIVRNQAHIVRQLEEVSQPVEPGAPVPPTELTAAVAFAETHLGCDHGEGGNWGAPISAARRHVAGTHLSAVRILSRSYQVCGNWDQAVMRFRTGLCNPRRSSSPLVRRQGIHYLGRIRWIIQQIHRRHLALEGVSPVSPVGDFGG